MVKLDEMEKKSVQLKNEASPILERLKAGTHIIIYTCHIYCYHGYSVEM